MTCIVNGDRRSWWERTRGSVVYFRRGRISGTLRVCSINLWLVSTTLIVIVTSSIYFQLWYSFGIAYFHSSYNIYSLLYLSWVLIAWVNMYSVRWQTESNIKFFTLDYELSTLPKDSSRNGKCSEPEPNISESFEKNENVGDSSKNFKATQTEIAMNNTIWETVEAFQPPEKVDPDWNVV